MKRLVCLLAVVLGLSALAEYQVFSFSMSFKTADMDVCNVGSIKRESWGIGSGTLKGYLVTVCCYPCGASMGKSYPTWLYVVRTSDKHKALWKIPCRVDGGLAGKKIYIEHLPDDVDRYVMSKDDIKYIKKADKAWMSIRFSTSEYLTYLFTKGKFSECVKMGLFGDNVSSAYDIVCNMQGSAGFKTDPTLPGGIQFQPYIKSASGATTGFVKTEHVSSFDPSNFSTLKDSPLQGNTKVSFNSSLTKAIKGYSDWKIIDSIIMAKIKHNYLKIEEPELEDGQWSARWSDAFKAYWW